MYKISPINSKEIARIVKGVHYGEASDIEYISIDTREKFNINTVYIAIKGKLYESIRCFLPCADRLPKTNGW